MKRRTFIFLTVAASVSLGAPLAGCRPSSRVRTLARPDFLSHICDEATIREIGAAYRAQTPCEAGKNKLIALLLADAGLHRTGTNYTADSARPQPTNISDTHLAQRLDKNVRDDYAAGRIVTCKGWVLSLTEARQCALRTIIDNN